MDWSSVKLVDKKYSDYKIGWIPIILKSFVILIALIVNIFIRKIICSLIPFAQVKRYIESIVNLICMRTTLFMLGFYTFQSDTFAYFKKDTMKVTLKSGFIGIGTHKSIIDFLYYSYILNPVFVRLVIYKRENKEQIFYAPLSFMEALQCALDFRGFDPIIVHNDRQYKNVKYRKLAMKTLVSECFEEINGPIFILLPGLHPNVHLSINKTLANDIYQNQVRYERSLVGIIPKLDDRALPSGAIYKNQLFVLLDLMSRFMMLKFKVDAIEYRKWKHRYDRVTYPSFVDKFYQDNELTVETIEYSEYLNELDKYQHASEPSFKQE